MAIAHLNRNQNNCAKLVIYNLKIYLTDVGCILQIMYPNLYNILTYYLRTYNKFNKYNANIFLQHPTT